MLPTVKVHPADSARYRRLQWIPRVPQATNDESASGIFHKLPTVKVHPTYSRHDRPLRRTPQIPQATDGYSTSRICTSRLPTAKVPSLHFTSCQRLKHISHIPQALSSRSASLKLLTLLVVKLHPAYSAHYRRLKCSPYTV